MLSVNARRFVLIGRKSFNIVCEGKKLDGLRISENQMENRVSITLNKDEVAWIVHILSDFYWNKGGETWGKTKKVDTIIFS